MLGTACHVVPIFVPPMFLLLLKIEIFPKKQKNAKKINAKSQNMPKKPIFPNNPKKFQKFPEMAFSAASAAFATSTHHAWPSWPTWSVS
jgi:hypothetical protein